MIITIIPGIQTHKSSEDGGLDTGGDLAGFLQWVLLTVEFISLYAFWIWCFEEYQKGMLSWFPLSPPFWFLAEFLGGYRTGQTEWVTSLELIVAVRGL